MTRLATFGVSFAAICLFTVSCCTNSAYAQEKNPIHTPGIEFLKDPIPAENSVAATEAEMKLYAEKVPGTEVPFKMIPIKGGKFVMGSPTSEEGRAENEGPQIEVEVAPFWIEEHEVTWGEFQEFGQEILKQRRFKQTDLTEREKLVDAMGKPTKAYNISAISYSKSSKLDHPASGLTYYAAQAYCKWLTIATGRYYRLPTEAEWEYACRAGTKTAYSFGDDPKQLENYAWFMDNVEEGYNAVKTKKPNAWGLYDMHGNVSEWVLGIYKEDAYQQYKDGKLKLLLINPEKWTMMHVAKGDNHIVRGGSCDQFADECRSASRNISQEDWKEQDPMFPKSIWYYTEAPYVGFRVVRPLTPPKDAEECKLYEPDTKIFDDYKELNTRQN
ncbi:MAG: formylglycine-generating enzyme family protein [Planctomycetaceae bacterium]|jgi:formylglycine-generating enzyme required for sulfatase activity|nr:formylglycine-generating enzyme family protein [Planctomycetaceae bacterium]